MSEEFSPLTGFAGTARLFPLPNLVFFPQVMQPLHIFEPRYRQMTADAIEGDRLMALVLLKPQWEKEYANTPPIHSVACLGKVVADQRLEDGRYNILLRGLSRLQIVHELPHNKQYRKAKVELMAEIPPDDAKLERRMRKRLKTHIKERFAQQAGVLEQFEQLLKSDLPIGTLCDIFAFALPLDVEFKQMLLEQVDVERRLKVLLDFLESEGKTAATTQRKFPPEFSAN